MPELVLSRTRAREVDRIAVDEYGLSSLVLMENAGRGVAELLMGIGVDGPVAICAGKGNNGGDGFVIARHLEIRGVDVRVLLHCDPAELRGDAAANFQVLRAARTPLMLMPSGNRAELESQLGACHWIVDALLGTGASGDVREPFRTIIESINHAEAHKLAVDIPSGLDCDTGIPMGCCVRADHTATFVARKKGFSAPGAENWTGRVHVIDIGVPRRLLNELGNQDRERPQGASAASS